MGWQIEGNFYNYHKDKGILNDSYDTGWRMIMVGFASYSQAHDYINKVFDNPLEYVQTSLHEAVYNKGITDLRIVKTSDMEAWWRHGTD